MNTDSLLALCFQWAGNEYCSLVTNTDSNTNTRNEEEEEKDAIMLHCDLLYPSVTCIFLLNLQQSCELGSSPDFPNKEPGAQSTK